jgi:two-component system, sensor histidine kinase and response regulator
MNSVKSTPDMNLLIVEDSPEQVDVLRCALESEHYRVSAANNGVEALALAKTEHPAAMIISNINLPLMNGYAICSAIRTDPNLKNIPVILMTALTEPLDVLQALQSGADAYLSKPYHLPSLLSWLQTLINQSHDSSPSMERRSTDFWVNGQRFSVHASSLRMLNLLFSTYENAVLQNRELVQTQLALKDLNANLEQRVGEQTAAVRQSDRRFRALIESASDLIMVIDTAGIVLFAGPSIKSMCGLKVTDALGQQYLNFVHPEDRARVAAKLKAVTINPERLQTFEQRFQHSNGHWMTQESNLKNALSDPSVGGIIINLRDISERKLAEAHIRNLSMAVEQSPESIMITDTDGRIQYINEACIQISGYSREELIGQNPKLFQSGRTPLATYQEMWAALLRHQSWTGEFYNRRKDGSEYLEMAIVLPIRQPNGQVTQYVAIKQDITEQAAMELELLNYRRHLEELVDSRTLELAEARERAEAANLAKSAFLANMSHEIRTPMNAIIGLVHLLRRNNPRPDQNERLGKIADAAHHLLAIINDILDLSKIEAGKLQLELSHFEPEKLIENVCNLVCDKAAAKGVEVIIDLRVIPAMLYGDAQRLTQVLLNLLGNAVKFTDSGSVRLSAWMSSASDTEVQAHFEVTDTGIGLTEQQRLKLFNPFEQADSSMTRKYGGTGLGLAISRRMVDLMGGRMGVESEIGQGSKFWFEVPFGFSNQVIPDYADQVVMRGLHMLLVDDLAETRESLADMMAMLGIGAHCATSAEQALTMLLKAEAAGAPFDLLLIEQQMQGVKGLELGKQITSLPLLRQPCRLLLTAYGEEILPNALAAAGYLDTLQKPLTPSRLYTLLQTALSGRVGSAAKVPTDGAESQLRRRSGDHVLLVEDDPINQEVALALIQGVGIKVDLAENGALAVERARTSAYNVILMDMQMPVMDGVTASKHLPESPPKHLKFWTIPSNVAFLTGVSRPPQHATTLRRESLLPSR